MVQEGFKRKLTAILNADGEGYSRLMRENEEATIRTLTGSKGWSDLADRLCEPGHKPDKFCPPRWGR
jgi:hypothetical protein